MLDPNFETRCQWRIPAGSIDPYAMQFKAVASLGDGCPTLDLVYAAPLNLVTSRDGLPVDAGGRVIDAANPSAVMQFRDLNGDSDFFDDSFLRDTRLKPMPLAGATVKIDRYSVIIPPAAVNAIAVVWKLPRGRWRGIDGTIASISHDSFVSEQIISTATQYYYDGKHLKSFPLSR